MRSCAKLLTPFAQISSNKPYFKYNYKAEHVLCALLYIMKGDAGLWKNQNHLHFLSTLKYSAVPADGLRC